MIDYKETIAYKQLINFLKSSYEVNLDNRSDIKENIIEYYIKESCNGKKNFENKILKNIDLYFEADSLDKKIILRKLDRIIKEINMNID